MRLTPPTIVRLREARHAEKEDWPMNQAKNCTFLIVQTTPRCRDHPPHNLPAVGGTIYTTRKLDHFTKLGIDSQRSIKLARKLHAHSVQHAHRHTSIRHAIENKNTRCNFGALRPRATRHPPDPH
eukprot:679097-Pelagomonas_calceolata.AAC.3